VAAPEEMSRAELTALVRRQDGQITTLSTQVADLLAVNEKLARLEQLGADVAQLVKP
jgi:hypothetical protein